MFKKIMLIVSVFLLPALLSAGTGGKIVGKVTDRETGEVLPGANVVVVGTLLGSASDAEGEFIILNVPVGTYSLRATFIGYQTVMVTEVRVNLDLTTEIDFMLPSETLELSEVSIVAERPLVNKNATNSISIKSSDEIQVLPLRGFRNVVSIDAGVTNVAGRTYVRGGRREEIATYIDGVYQNLPLTGRASGDISNNAIEEVNFQAGGFNAEYGFANSGVINVTSKSGGANYNFTGEVITDAWLSKKDKRFGTYGYGYNVYNAALSGPLPAMGDKVKFYLGVERQDFADVNPSGFAYNALKMDANGNPLNASGEQITFTDAATAANIVGGINLDDAFPTYDLNGDGVQDYQWDEQGVWPNRGNEAWLWNANLTIDASANMKFKIGGNSRRSDGNDLAGFSPGADFANNLDGAGIGFTLWNADNNPRFQSWQDSYFAKLTHTLGDRTFYTFQANYFRDDFKRTSEMFGDAFWNIGDKDDQVSRFGPGSDGITNPYIQNLGTRPPLDPRSAQLFSSLGTQPAIYQDRRWSFWGIKGDVTHQLDKTHEFKAGVEYRYNTYKSYTIGGYGAADLHSLAANLATVNPSDATAITPEQAYQARFADPFGFDMFGQDGSVGTRNGAKNPVIASAYLQDKIELEDLVVNIGIRWDYFDPANDGIIDVERVTTTTDQSLGGINVIAEENFKGNQTKSTISPRLGFSFPVTDKTVFHAQYGKFVQTPELARLYASTVDYGQNLQSGNFFTQENPNLDLIKTTSYEIGFRQQIGDNSALDITAYYKEIINYVRLNQLDNAVPVPYAIYTSEDYGTVKGMTFTYNMRPVSRVSASANYTLQYAAGTGSDANTLYNIAWQGGRTPTFVAPLDFDQRHTGAANIDYRSKSEDTFGRWGLNALLTFSSGLSYTPVRPQTEVLAGTSGYFPIAQVGSAQGPWTYQLDLKLDKTFSISQTDLVVYLWVVNVTNALNATWVYPGTGAPDNDGYFDTVAGKDFLKIWGENGKELYNFLLRDPYMAGPPRQFRLGLRLEM
jgi:outer membrane receptor protein involved in Fe transport